MPINIDEYVKGSDNPEQMKQQIIAFQMSAEEGELARGFASNPFYKLLTNYFDLYVKDARAKLESGKCETLEEYRILTWVLQFFSQFKEYLTNTIEGGESAKDYLEMINKEG